MHAPLHNHSRQTVVQFFCCCRVKLPLLTKVRGTPDLPLESQYPQELQFEQVAKHYVVLCRITLKLKNNIMPHLQDNFEVTLLEHGFHRQLLHTEEIQVGFWNRWLYYASVEAVVYKAILLWKTASRPHLIRKDFLPLRCGWFMSKVQSP